MSIHFEVSANPTAAWIWQQFLNATPWGRQPRHLIHDRDAMYGKEFGPKLRHMGVARIRKVLAEFIAYYNHDRPHRSLAMESPIHRLAVRDGPIIAWPVLGGLDYAYARAA